MKCYTSDHWMGGLLLLAGLAVLAGACDARGREGQGGAPERAAWQECEGGSDWRALVQAGRVLGYWNEDTGEVRAMDPILRKLVTCGERAGTAADARRRIELTQAPGLDVQQVRRAAPGYRMGGRVVTEAEAFAALKPQPKLPDDSACMSLSVIGPADLCAQVDRDMATHPALQKVRPMVVYQTFRPDDWQVARSGFDRSGKPTVYCQAPDGTVLFRDSAYPGAELLASAIEKSWDQCCPKRDPDPTYQPEKDRTPKVVVHPTVDVPWGWIVSGLLGMACFFVVPLAAAIAVVAWNRSKAG